MRPRTKAQQAAAAQTLRKAQSRVLKASAAYAAYIREHIADGSWSTTIDQSEEQAFLAATAELERCNRGRAR